MKRSKLAAGQGIGLILVFFGRAWGWRLCHQSQPPVMVLAWQPHHHLGDLEELPLASSVLCVPHVGGNVKLPPFLPRETEERTQHTLGFRSRLPCACGRGVI